MKTGVKRMVVGCAVFALLATTLLTGCGSKEAITADDFRLKATAAGYEVVDITDQYAEESGGAITEALAFDDGAVHVEFYQIDSETNAKIFYTNNAATVETYEGSTAVSSRKDGKYSKYSMTSDGVHYVIERVGTTAIYSRCSADSAKTMDGFIESLGY
jgi:hypothetical protein